MRPTRPWPLLLAGLFLTVACGDEDDDVKDDGGGTPAILGAVVSTTEDTPVSGMVPVEGGGVTSVVVEQPPAHGTLVMTLGTEFVYTPATDYVGTDFAVVLVHARGVELRGAVTVTITPVNDAPRVAGGLTVEEDGLLRVAADTLALTDPDSPASTLSVTLLPGGAAYTAIGDILRPPPSFVGELTAAVVLSDGSATAIGSVNVTVTPVNDPPTNIVPIPQRTPIDAPFAFDGNLAVSDLDAGDAPLLVMLTTDTGTFTLAALDGLTLQAGTGTDDGAVTMTGARDAINAALDGFTVSPPSGFTGIITLTLRTDDQGATGAGGARVDEDTFLLGVGGVDLPPFNTVPDTAECDEDGAMVFAAGTASEISVIDIDLTAADSIAITLEATQGVIDLQTTSGLSFSNGSGSGTGDTAMSFEGTLAAVNAALDGLTFTPSANYAGAATVRLLSTSNALSDDDTVAVTVRAVNDAPVVTGPAALTLPNNVPHALTGGETVSIADVDAAGSIVRVGVTAANGGVTVDTSAVSVVSSSATQVVVDGTIASLNTALTSLTFTPTSGFVGSATLTIAVTDNGNIGAGGAAVDDLVIGITLFDANSPPTAAADTYASRGNTVLTVAAASGVLANDSDADGTIAGATAETVSSTLGGSVTIASDGSFTYLPPVGVGNAATPVADGFAYTVRDDDGATTAGNVTVNLGQVIWYVDGAQAGDGRSSSAFETLDDAVAEADAGDIIYVSGGPYLGSIVVPAGVELVGSGVALDRGPNGTLAAGTAPTIDGTGIAVITLASGCTLRGIRIAPLTDPGYPGIVVDGTGAVSIVSVEVRKHSPGILVKNTPSFVGITSSTIADTAGDALSLVRDTPGNSDVSLSDVRFEDTRLGNGILARATNSGSLGIVAEGLRARRIDTNGVDAAAIGTNSLISLVVATSDFANDTAAAIGDTAIRVVAAGTGAIANFDIDHDTFDAWPGAAVSVEASDPGSAITGRIRDNIITSSVPSAFQVAAVSVLVDAPSASGAGTGIVVVSDNNITVGADGGLALDIKSRDGASHVLDTVVTRNDLHAAGTDAFSFTGSSGADLCLDLTANNATSGAVAYQVTSGGPTMTIPNLVSDVETFLASVNTGAPVSFSGSAADGPDCAVP